MPNFIKGLYMSKSTRLTSRSLSKDWYISWVIEGSWFMEELPGRKPDWLDESKSFSLKTCSIKVFQGSYCRSEAKRQVGSFWRTVYHFFCGSELYWLFFHSMGDFIWLRHSLKIIEKRLHREEPNDLTMSFDTWTLLGRFSVITNFLVSLLLFFGGEHYSAKNVLKKFNFFSKISNEFIIIKYRGYARNLFITEFIT